MTIRLGMITAAILCASCGGAAVTVTTPPAPPAAAGMALKLNGTDAWMTAAYPEPDPFTAEATVSAWARFDILPSEGHRIFSIAGKSGFAKDLDLQAEEDNHFHFYVASGAPHTAVSTTTIQVGKWYRVDATYRANEVIILYVNRVPEATVAITGVARNANDGPITVGENATFHGRFFQGQIDDVSLWNRAFSPAEIAAAHFPTGREPGLIAAYAFDGNASDASGQGHDGKLLGGATFEAPGAPAY